MVPEPTAEELNYALGARHAPPEPAGPTDVEIRLQAVDLAVRLRSGTIRMTRKADDSGVAITAILADATALESYIRDGQTGALEFGPGVDFGPAVACSCGPNSVAHTHDAPWGCTTCSCRFYVAFGDAEESTNDAERPEDAAHHFAAELVRLNTELARRGYQPSPGTPLDTAPVDTALAAVDRLTRDVNTLRLDVADLMPEDAVETPEQSTAIVDGNLAAMSLTVEAGDRGAPCGCRAYDPNHNHHTTAEHTNCGPGLPCGGCDSCISGQAYHGDRLAKEAGGA